MRSKRILVTKKLKSKGGLKRKPLLRKPLPRKARVHLAPSPIKGKPLGRLPKIIAPLKKWGEVATPYLVINDPSPWFKEPPLNGTCDVNITVRNEGNATSYCTVVELYEGPFMVITPPFVKDCELRGRKVVELHPGVERQLTLSYVRKRSAGQAIGICYDPFHDPKAFEKGIGFGIIDRKNISHAVRYYGS